MSEYRAWLYVLAFGIAAVSIANIAVTGEIPGVPMWAHWLAALPLGGAAMALFLEAGDKR